MQNNLAAPGVADTTDPLAPAPEAPTSDDNDAKLIAKFEDMLRFPKYVEKWVDRFEEDRTYVNETCMLIDETDTVATNYILRNQYVVGAQINYRDPAVSVQPAEGMYGVDPVTGQELPTPSKLMDFAKTLRIYLQKQLPLINFKRVMNGAVQDSDTVGIAYLKLCLQEDYMRDPIGRKRQDDQQDNIARLRMLSEMLADSQDTDCAEYQEMLDLTESVKAGIIGELHEQMNQYPPENIPVMMPGTDPITGAPTMVPQLDEFGVMMMQPDPNDARSQRINTLKQPGLMDVTTLPEIQHFIGYNLEQVLPEDSRWDMDVIRPEDFYSGRSWANRVYMTVEQIKTKWRVGDDYFQSMKSNKPLKFQSKNARSMQGSNDDPAKRNDKESDKLGDKPAVWEQWYKETGHVYVWVAGCSKFLDKYIPEVTWRGFFPCFPVYSNRVPGRFLPIAGTRLVMQLQDEINTLRTHGREARKASYPRFICKKGLFRKGEKEKFEKAQPYSITEADKAEDIAKGIHEIAPVKFVPQLYDARDATREMEIMLGVPQQAAGGVGGAKFATETAIADKQMERQSDYRANSLDDVFGDILEAMAEMAVTVISSDAMKMWVGPGAYWPDVGRDEMYRQLRVNILPGSAGKPDTKKKLDLLQNVTTIVSNFMMIPGADAKYALKTLFELAEIRDISPEKLFPLIPPPMPAVASPPGGKATPASNPEGAPPMTEPRQPETLPNHQVQPA